MHKKANKETINDLLDFLRFTLTTTLECHMKDAGKIAGLTLEEFCARSSVTASFCTPLVSGKSVPSARTIRTIWRVWHIGKEAAHTGEGEKQAPA